MTLANVIATSHLSKSYKAGTKALDALNLTVEPGEVFGYLGPNGAGKTTTIRLLLDLIRPSAGSARVFGLEARANARAIHARIGYLPGELTLWDNLTAQQTIDHFAGLRGIRDRRFITELAEQLEFDVSKQVRTYSTGNKRKLGLILALMGKPDLLILDEPTSGLDPLMQQTIYQILRQVRAEGRTVFLSSHILGEVQAICDRVGILRHGQLKSVQRVDDLTRTQFRHVRVTFREPVTAAALALDHAREIQTAERSLSFQWHGPIDTLLRSITTAGGYVEDFSVQEPSLEDIFLTFYADEPAVLPAALSAAAPTTERK